MSQSNSNVILTNRISLLKNGSKMAYLTVKNDHSQYELYLSRINYISVICHNEDKEKSLSLLGKTFSKWADIGGINESFNVAIGSIKDMALQVTKQAYGQSILLN